MANVSFANLDELFDQYNANYVTKVGGGAGEQPTYWAWFTDFLGTGVLEFGGTGFTYSGGTLTGGTVNQFRLDVSANTLLTDTTDIKITGLSFDGSLLTGVRDGSLTPDQENNLVWRTVLSGDDTINMGSGGFFVNFAADGRHVEAGQVLAGGNDTFTGTMTSGNLSGDYWDVLADAAAIGGDDNMTGLSGSGQLYGDANNVFGVLYGGNDIIRQLGSGPVRGDATAVLGGAVVGGDDVITMTNGSAYGDVVTIGSDGTLTGGDDTIIGNDAPDALFGDAVTIAVDATSFTGGHDTLYGGDDADLLYGDWQVNDLGSAAKGGNDKLFGGQGPDQLFGNAGLDFLEGGRGADDLDGGEGTGDWASFKSSFAAVQINLNTGSITGGEATGDTITGIERLLGSAYNDVLTGDSSNNVLDGSLGNDSLNGGSGDDKLLGNFGNDFLRGQAGADILNGGSGGSDWAFYDTSPGQVSVFLNSGLGFNNDAEGDTLFFVERILGSKFNDSLSGDAKSNYLRGSNGDDWLRGLQGLDYLRGDSGADSFVFHSRSDIDVVLDFQDNIDILEIDDAVYGGGLTAADIVSTYGVQNGAHAYLDFGGGDSFRILNTQLADIVDDILIF